MGRPAGGRTDIDVAYAELQILRTERWIFFVEAISDYRPRLYVSQDESGGGVH
jgi:hypothetical protein